MGFASVALFALLIAASQGALACSCMRPTPQQHFQRHALIFTGTAEWVDHKAGRARFKVHTLYKGEVENDVVEIRYNNGPGASCGTGFTVGERETVFAGYVAETPGREMTYSTGLCSMIPYRSSPLTFQPALDAYRLAVREAATRAEREPGSVKAWLALAEIQESNRDYVPAVRTFDRLQKLAPATAAFHTRQGQALAALGRFAPALAAYDKAVALDAGDATAARGRDQALIRLGKVASIDPKRRDYAGMTLPASDFSGRELTGASFAKAQLQQPNFAQARLAGADFSAATISGGDFKGADLRGAKFSGTSSYSSDFSAANLSGANLTKAQLQAVKFDRADLSNADLTEASFERSSLANARLAGARLKGTQLYHADLSGTDLSGMDLSRHEMQGVSLRGAKLVKTNLTGAYLSGPHSSARSNEALHGVGRPPDLRGADLSGASLTGTDLRFAFFDCKTKWPSGFDAGTQLLIPVTSSECPGPPQKTKLFDRPGELREIPGKIGGERAKTRGPEVEKLDFTGIDLAGANLSGFRLWSVVFRNARLRGVDLRNATLAMSDFRGADLAGADFTGAGVESVDFSTAQLAGATFTGAVYNEATRWPTGFDAAKAGAVLQPTRVPRRN